MGVNKIEKLRYNYIQDNMKKVVQSVFVVTVILLAFSGCKSRELNTQFSNTTGWNYYDEKTTNFEAKEGVGNVDPVGMVAIQGGTFAIHNSR